MFAATQTANAVNYAKKKHLIFSIKIFFSNAIIPFEM